MENLNIMSDQTETQYLYIITNPAWPGWVKIGHTLDPYECLQEHDNATPRRDFRMNPFVVQDGEVSALHFRDALYADEAYITVRGDWYEVSYEDALAILARCQLKADRAAAEAHGEINLYAMFKCFDARAMVRYAEDGVWCPTQEGSPFVLPKALPKIMQGVALLN